MSYAVLYYSETGNTEKLAKQIYAAIDSDEKEIINLEAETQVPQADIYFVGFPIQRNNCSMKVVDALDQMEDGKVVFFATCGMKPTEKYKKKLEDTLSIWVPDDVEYLGMFLCQGKTTPEQKKQFCDANPNYKDKIQKMLDDGNSHPNEQDFEDAFYYVKEILQYQDE
jgi:flavodoxin